MTNNNFGERLAKLRESKGWLQRDLASVSYTHLQFPVAIPQRLIKALTHENALVLDPFMGSGTTGVAAVVEKRRFAGAELQADYYDIAIGRITDAVEGRAKIRDDVPVATPNPNAAVAKLPEEFAEVRKDRNG